MVTPTWSQLRQLFLGWLRTDLTSEFTHFNLVIHLSKAKQLAFPFISLFAMSGWSRGPLRTLVNALLRQWSRLEQPKTFSFSSAQLLDWHMNRTHTWLKATDMSFSCRCGHFGSWWGWTYRASNSVELEQPFMSMWLDLTTVPAGSDARHSRIELSPP